ncbi:MAG: MATE family efflux transporter [Myxococcota bacterium]
MLPPVTRRELVRLAAPAAASAILNNAFRVIDQLAAGWIGTPAQAAIGSCTFVLISFYGVYCLVAGGAGPLVARATGAGDEDLRARAVGTSLAAAAGLGGIVGVVGFAGADVLARVLGLEGEVARDAATFLRWLSVFAVPAALHPTLDAVFVAVGRTRLMMALQVGAAVLNAVLNPLLIQHAGLGVAGAAIATGASRTLMAGIGLWAAWRAFGPRIARDDTLRRVARVGWPVTVATVAYALVYFLLLRVTISPLGPAVNAALGIGFSALEGLSYPCFLGIGLAVSSLVGRSLGAGRPDEARRAAELGLPMVTALGLAAGAVFWFGARPLCALFTDDPAVLDAAVVYARVLAISQVCVAWEALAEGVLAGAGDTRTIFWLSAPFNFARIPLAWLLAFPLGMGAAGVWWAINVTSACKALTKGYAVRRGAWTRMRI